jgi:hypothetical protein
MSDGSRDQTQLTGPAIVTVFPIASLIFTVSHDRTCPQSNRNHTTATTTAEQTARPVPHSTTCTNERGIGFKSPVRYTVVDFSLSEARITPERHTREEHVVEDKL